MSLSSSAGDIDAESGWRDAAESCCNGAIGATWPWCYVDAESS
jgi:hypothetical protein